MSNSEESFEEGKTVEEYVADLDSLVIPPEPNPDVEQRLENVVEEPVRNEKKKPVQPAPQVQVPPPVHKEPVAQPPVVEQPKPPEQPKIPEPQVPEQPVQVEQQFTTLDEYIQRTAEAVKQEWLGNAYRNMIGVATGQFQIVRAQAQLPQQQQVQQPQQQERIVVKDNSEAVELLRAEVNRIESEIIDSSSDADLRLLQAEKRLLKKQIQKLEGTYVERPEVEQPVTPVSAKVANPQKVKEGGGGSNVTPKVALALVGLFLICGIGVILVLNSIFH